MFAHKLVGHYSTPEEYDMFNGGYRMSISTPNLLGKIDELVAVTYKHAVETSKVYKSGDVILMFGHDFSHPIASMSY